MKEGLPVRGLARAGKYTERVVVLNQAFTLQTWKARWISQDEF
jgi:hypothetical protein